MIHQTISESNDVEEKIMSDDLYLDRIIPLSDTKTWIDYVPIDKTYVTNWARIGPFLTSRGRQEITKYMSSHIGSVRWIHTDGFITSEKLDIETGSTMGQLKYEGKCENVQIINCISKKGEFIV
jgi:hypothetical protein